MPFFISSIVMLPLRENGTEKKLKLHCGPGDDTEPVLTSMLPEEDLEGEINFINSEDVVRQYVVSQAALWSELTYEARHEIIKEVVERIDVSKESLHFNIHHISSLNKKDGETIAVLTIFSYLGRHQFSMSVPR